MKLIDVYNLINNVEGKNANVKITSNVSGKVYSQNLHISSANILKIRSTSSKAEGYNVTQPMCDKWEKVDIKKKRNTKKSSE